MSELRVIPMTCPNCGAKLEVSGDTDQFTCAYCGSELTVLRRGGHGLAEASDRSHSQGQVEAEKLTAALGSAVTERVTVHAWPLSCVQRLRLADGRRYTFKTQLPPTVEPEFYARAIAVQAFWLLRPHRAVEAQTHLFPDQPWPVFDEWSAEAVHHILSFAPDRV